MAWHRWRPFVSCFSEARPEPAFWCSGCVWRGPGESRPCVLASGGNSDCRDGTAWGSGACPKGRDDYMWETPEASKEGHTEDGEITEVRVPGTCEVDAFLSLMCRFFISLLRASGQCSPGQLLCRIPPGGARPLLQASCPESPLHTCGRMSAVSACVCVGWMLS